MKLSFATMATPDLNGVDAIRLASQMGFDGVDLRVSHDRGELVPGLNRRKLRELREVANAERISLPCLLCYNPTEIGTRLGRKQFTSSLWNYLRLAEEVGAESIRILPGQGNENQLDVLVELIGQISQEEGGTARLLVQNHSKGWSMSDTVRLVQSVNLPRVRWFCSPEHGVLRSENVKELLKKNMEWIGSVFFADLAPSDSGFHDALPGRGIVPWECYLGLIQGFHDQEWISFKWEKIWRDELADCQIALPSFLRYVGQWRARS